MRVNHLLQFGKIGGRCRAFHIDHAPDFVEAGANIVFHREEAAQVEQSFELDRDAFEPMPSAVA